MRVLAISFALFILGCATKPVQNVAHQSVKNEKNQPKVNDHIIMIDHKFFKIAYNKEKRLAQYVTYELTKEHVLNKKAERENKFIVDPILEQKNIPLVRSSEYSKTGYDRGHLAPSADFAWNQEANNLTFVMSNMAPQKPKLNRDAWKRLEDQVRKWACGEERITVITGPILKDGLPTLKSGLVVPEEFFKVIIDETPPQKMISFIFTQSDSGNVMAERIVPIEKLEVRSGIAFNQEFNIKNGFKRLPASLNSWAECD